MKKGPWGRLNKKEIGFNVYLSAGMLFVTAYFGNCRLVVV